MTLDQAWLVPAFALAAFLYSSVGHGGASAYLALGTLAGLARGDFVPMALLLNVAVASIALWTFRDHLRREILLPFIITSIPAAFLGARLNLSSTAFAALLGAAVFSSGVHLAWPRTATADGSATAVLPVSSAQVGVDASVRARHRSSVGNARYRRRRLLEPARSLAAMGQREADCTFHPTRTAVRADPDGASTAVGAERRARVGAKRRVSGVRVRDLVLGGDVHAVLLAERLAA